MPWSLQGITGNLETLFNEIRAQRDHWINIEKRQTGSRIALKSKIWIDQHFRGEDSFSDLSKWLGVDQSVLGREFKACYGVSPSVFRKKLRTTTAMLSLVLKGGNVTDVGTQVGYGDLDHFTKQFRANLLALPSQFKPPKEFYESVFRETNIVHEK